MKRGTRMHAHHAAILYSLLAEAYGRARTADPCIPDGLLLDAPEQSRVWLAPQTSYAFGFSLFAATPLAATQLVDLLIRGLRQVGRDGGPAKTRAAALGGNFDVQRVEDLVSGRTRQAGGLLEPLPWEWIEREIEQLASHTQLTLRFLSPLRAHRSKNTRRDGHQYFDRFQFDAGAFTRRIATRLAALGMPAGLDVGTDLPPPIVRDNQLVWLDLSYGPRATRKALGGGLGRIELTAVQPSTARCLVWGQYVRIGEATRFGFGRYRIEQLGPDPTSCQRAVELLDLIADQSSLDEEAVRAELGGGEARAAAERLRTGHHFPQPHFLMSIAKSDGNRRQLSIPSRLDRVLQRAVLQAVGPAIDLFLEESSLAYRRGLGRHTAARRLKESFAEGYRWALKADFHAFFDSIDHRQLRGRLEAYTADDRLTETVMRWVEAGVGNVNRGIPTGAPLSPLLANLFLDEFDESIASTGRRLVRYADDFVILFRERSDADQVLAEARQAAESLRLELNRDKTRAVELSAGFDFLGYRFAARDSWEFSGPDGPQPIEELGWKEARRANHGVERGRLAGESELAMPLTGVVIAGPDLTELRVHNDSLQFEYRERRGVEAVSISALRELWLLGPVTLAGPVLEALRRANSELVLLDQSGRSLATLELDTADAPGLDAVGLAALIDASRQPATRLTIARQLISAKLHNYAELARAYPAVRPDRVEEQLRKLSIDAQQAETLESLLGVEGRGAAVWYGALGPRLPQGFSWTRRVAPQAEDPINILLNLAFTVLYRFVRHALRHAQLADSVGLLHESRAGHAALASDLQEPFRHLMDRAVLETLRRVSPTDFVADERGPYPVRIQPRGLREALAWIHRVLAKSCHGSGQSEPLAYRLQILKQARSLRRALTTPTIPFEPFRHP